MSTNGKRLKWTQDDQQALDQLVERKDEFYRTYQTPIDDFVRSTLHGNFSVAKWMIHNADTIRDLLLPFDSGVRGPDAAEG